MKKLLYLGIGLLCMPFGKIGATKASNRDYAYITQVINNSPYEVVIVSNDYGSGFDDESSPTPQSYSSNAPVITGDTYSQNMANAEGDQRQPIYAKIPPKQRANLLFFIPWAKWHDKTKVKISVLYQNVEYNSVYLRDFGGGICLSTLSSWDSVPENDRDHICLNKNDIKKKLEEKVDQPINFTVTIDTDGSISIPGLIDKSSPPNPIPGVSGAGIPVGAGAAGQSGVIINCNGGSISAAGQCSCTLSGQSPHARQVNLSGGQIVPVIDTSTGKATITYDCYP